MSVISESILFAYNSILARPIAVWLLEQQKS